MREHPLFLALLGINFLLLFAQIKGLSISFTEAQLLYGEFTPLQWITSLSLKLFGHNDYALRFPMIAIHLMSMVLLFLISKPYVRKEFDRIWIILIYALLPGVASVALVLDSAGIVIVGTFLFVYLFQRNERYSIVLIPFLFWLDPAFIPLFIGTAIYGLMNKRYLLGTVGGLFFGASLALHGIEIGGIPQGRFLDALGVYAAIFSPIVFLYFFYVLYRRFIANQRDLLWTIASSAFLISILLSFRQKVPIQTFAPFMMLVLPLSAQTFLETYRVRLREFRKRYAYLFYSALVLLVLNAMAVFFNQYFYRFFENPKDHFAYSMHVAKELARTLHQEKIECVDARDEKLQLRLRFYGISQCENILFEDSPHSNGKKVTISYKNTPVFTTYVTKLNKN
jgi:hypothetical protein